MWRIALGALFVILLDFVSKSWARANLTFGVSQVFIPQVLNLTLTTNLGGAFGFGRQFGYAMTIVAFFIFFAILGWVFTRFKSKDKPGKLEQAGMSCLLGGALGNLLDRILYGKVTDFLEFSFIQFPVFNVADAVIDLGIVLILLSYFKQSK